MFKFPFFSPKHAQEIEDTIAPTNEGKKCK